ncbi:Thioredoxin-like domain [seawater metagenome]|uniref:Thioredoxin-like domain n=1 Tax=seawater metagenome TaxID=1561972 RepID=A0A5E8CLY6_9ZZZZ
MKNKLLAVIGGIITINYFNNDQKSRSSVKSQYNNLIKNASEDNKKYIFIYFSGSDWCGWCKQYHSNILEDKKFQEYLNKHFYFYNADFPQRKTLSQETKNFNRYLAKNFGIKGYPTIKICDSEGELIGESRFSKTPKDVIKHLNSIINN